MIIRKKRFLQILSDTIIKTAKACGRNLSIKQQQQIIEHTTKGVKK